MRRRTDFVRLIREGTRFYSNQYTLIAVNNDLNVVRLAMSIKKNLVNAAGRNYEKRVVRECFRMEKDRLKKGFDILVIINRVTTDFNCSYRSLKDLLCRL